MKKLLLLLILCIGLFQSKAYSQETRDWTLLVYLVGSDLESGSDAGTTDIAEMLAGTEGAEYVNVVVLTGGANKVGWETPRCFLMNDGTQTELTYTPVSPDMANPANVTQFINYGISNYPAQSYMLTFWNHGGDIQGFGWEEQFGHHLSISQVQQSVGASTFIQDGNKFDILGFDACLMASLEVLYTLRDYAHYFVASEEEEPGHGWNYTPIIEAMEDGNHLYGDELGSVVVNSFLQHAVDEATSAVTLAVLNAAHMSTLEEKYQALLNRITTESKMGALQRAVSASEEYGKAIETPSSSSDVVDLGDLMAHLKSIDSSLSPEIDEVLVALDSVVVHHANDMSRPKATGITVFIPHNTFTDDEALSNLITNEFGPLDIPAAWKTFISDTYITYVQEDNTPPSGFVNQNPSGIVSGGGCDTVVSLTVNHDNDLEQIRVVLKEEFVDDPNEYVLLGSTFPDEIITEDENTQTFVYHWDGYWLGINGYAAYIADIHDYTLEDENGNPHLYHRIHIPAVVNFDTPQEKDIMIAYRFDEDFNIVLENIRREPYGEGERIVPKERVQLQPGDQVQIRYELYNELTGEMFYLLYSDEVITIENGNEDLHLEYSPLIPNNYQIGFVLLDHSHNDTLIFNECIYQIDPTDTEDTFTEIGIGMYPVPTDGGFHLNLPEHLQGQAGELRLTDLSGRSVLRETFTDQLHYVDTQRLPAGIYTITLFIGKQMFTDKIVIQH